MTTWTRVPLLLLALFGALAAADNSDTADDVVASARNLEVGPGIAAGIAIGVGLAVATCGYRLLRPAMFACGFLVGGYILSTIVHYIVDGKSYENTAWWISFIVGGAIVGSLVVAIYNAGIFLIGAAGGVFLATLINTSFGYRIYPSDPTTGLLVLAIVLAIICGVLAFKIEKMALIVATALAGSVLTVNGLGYFIGDFPTTTDLEAYRSKDSAGDWVYDIPDAWWGYLAGILALFVLSLLVQIKKTARK
jgi:hypothetical protein